MRNRLTMPQRPVPVQLMILATLVAALVSPAVAQRGPDIPSRPEIQVTALDINEAADDFAPVVLRGGDLLLFTSSRPSPFSGSGSQRIWSSTHTPSGWSTPWTTGEALANARHVGGAALTPDGNFMIFAAYDWEGGPESLEGFGRTDLYSAIRVGGEWANITNLGPALNSDAWDSQPTLSADGRTLYFSSDREGGLGLADIYVSKLTPSGWTPAVNLGPAINTPADDMSPTIAPDDKSLFFATNGRGGAGGFDLFIATGGEASGLGWGGVENLGTPINSAYDEYFFVSIPNSRNSYFCSDRGGFQDIYLAYPNPFPPDALVTVSGNVIDATTRMPIAAAISVTDLTTGEIVADYRTDDRTGTYFVMLARGRRYSITAESPRHVFYSNEYTIPANAEGKDLKKDIVLYPAAGGQTRLLVFFDFDKSELQKESVPDLRRAVQFLKSNPELNVEIGGHTDSLGTDAYNLQLSQQRAESVMRFLSSAGIGRERMKARGYGEAQPVADNASEEGQANNRRVEMRVMGPTSEPAQKRR
ncbi:MAG TPA: OmpA family protein [Candidatus Kapabacteria bacterium]|nr:OmpA family protein [Candidatus Kapabacteria bacterium]